MRVCVLVHVHMHTNTDPAYHCSSLLANGINLIKDDNVQRTVVTHFLLLFLSSFEQVPAQKGNLTGESCMRQIGGTGSNNGLVWLARPCHEHPVGATRRFRMLS